MANTKESVLAAWPRLEPRGDVYLWADQIIDRLRYLDNWIVVGRTLKPRNPNWEVGGVTPGGGGSRVWVGSTPPTGTLTSGDMWWRNTDGTLYVYYDDGNSTQWVPATPSLMGPQGPPGTAGDLAYRHIQATAATTWTITHNLSFRPNVAAVDSTGREIWPGTVDYTSATTVTLGFSAAVGGEAYLS